MVEARGGGCKSCGKSALEGGISDLKEKHPTIWNPGHKFACGDSVQTFWEQVIEILTHLQLRKGILELSQLAGHSEVGWLRVKCLLSWQFCPCAHLFSG